MPSIYDDPGMIRAMSIFANAGPGSPGMTAIGQGFLDARQDMRRQAVEDRYQQAFEEAMRQREVAQQQAAAQRQYLESQIQRPGTEMMGPPTAAGEMGAQPVPLTPHQQYANQYLQATLAGMNPEQPLANFGQVAMAPQRMQYEQQLAALKRAHDEALQRMKTGGELAKAQITADRPFAVKGNVYNPRTGSWIEGPSGGNVEFSDLRAARNDVLKADAKFGDVSNSLNQIVALADSPGPFADVAVVTKLAKLLDPGSVVRPAESAAISEAGGLIDQIISKFQQARRKGFITDPVREDIRRSVNKLAQIYRNEYQQQRLDTERFLTDSGMDTRLVMGTSLEFPQFDLGPAPATEQGTPLPGNPDDWEPVDERARNQRIFDLTGVP